MRAQLLSRMPIRMPHVVHLLQQRASFALESRVAGNLVRAVPVRSAAPSAPSPPVQSVVDNEELQAALAAMNISEMTEVQVRAQSTREFIQKCRHPIESCVGAYSRPYHSVTKLFATDTAVS